MDGDTLISDGNDFATQSKVASLGGAVGLPRRWRLSGQRHDDPAAAVRMEQRDEQRERAPSREQRAHRLRLRRSGRPIARLFPEPQIYATGTNGAQTVNYTLTYTTGTPQHWPR